ncbi:MAG: metal ABC transporter substrate-binding protein, partial [Planctomycetota bacterium]|nr:metal ABC transporter substrate-binding protein [Planctomycetota bacterium]
RAALFTLLSFVASVSTADAQDKLDIIATIPDLGNLVEVIGGERVNVEVLVKPGSDPHSVLPKASMLLKLSHADGLVLMGLDYEHAFLPAMLEKCRNRAVEPGAEGYMNVGARITALEIPQRITRADGADLHPRGNPHYNLDPENGRIMAAAVRDLLVRIDPGSKAGYQERWKAWDQEAKQLIGLWKKQMAPLEGKKVVVYHKSWIYFAKFFGLDVVAAIEPKPGISPSASHLVKVKRLMREHQVRVILMEPWYNASTVRGLVGDDVTVLRIATASGVGKESSTYLGFLAHLVASMRQAYGLKEQPKDEPANP